MWRVRWGPRTEPSPSHPPWRGQTSGTSPLGGDCHSRCRVKCGLNKQGHAFDKLGWSFSEATGRAFFGHR